MKRIARGVLPFLLSFACLAGAAQAEVVLSADNFRDVLARTLQNRLGEGSCVARLPNAGMRFGASADDCRFTAYTQSLYDDYLNDTSRLETLVLSEADRLAALPTAAEGDKDFNQRLVVQLRPKSFVEQANVSGASPLAARAFAGDLFAVLMLDSPETLSNVTIADLGGASLDTDAAFRLAQTNTRSRMGEIVSDSYGDVSRMYSVNGLISGQVWLPETCEAKTAGGVYFLYDYNGVLTVAPGDFVGISNLLKYARNMVEEGDSLSSTVVNCSGGEWHQLWPAHHVGLPTDLSKPRAG